MGVDTPAERKGQDRKKCKTCLQTVRDKPALKRHCSEVHKEDIDGNLISVPEFRCPIMACPQYLKDFKRREKLENHIRTLHSEETKWQVNGGMSLGKVSPAVITHNTVEAANDFGGYHGAAGMSARAHHDSAEVGFGNSPVLGRFLPPPEDVQPAPVAETGEMTSGYVRSQVLQP
jgi:hypothetical protein